MRLAPIRKASRPLDDPHVLRSTIGALSQYFVGSASIEQTLGIVAQLGTDTLPGADLAGITMLTGRHPDTGPHPSRTGLGRPQGTLGR